MVPDSAATASAMYSGVKTTFFTMGYNSRWCWSILWGLWIYDDVLYLYFYSAMVGKHYNSHGTDGEMLNVTASRIWILGVPLRRLRWKQYSIGLRCHTFVIFSKSPSNLSFASLLNAHQAAGKRTGFVTTTRMSHATPAALYAKTVHRFWGI